MYNATQELFIAAVNPTENEIQQQIQQHTKKQSSIPAENDGTRKLRLMKDMAQLRLQVCFNIQFIDQRFLLFFFFYFYRLKLVNWKILINSMRLISLLI